MGCEGADWGMPSRNVGLRAHRLSNLGYYWSKLRLGRREKKLTVNPCLGEGGGGVGNVRAAEVLSLATGAISCG